MAPATDFFGNPRPDGSANQGIDRGAVETQGGGGGGRGTTTPAPTLASISPTSGLRGNSVTVTLTGTDLTGATAVNVSGSLVTVSGISVNGGGNRLTATFAISSTAVPGARTVSVTTPGGTSNTVTFTVN